MQPEVWKPIFGFEGYYDVSNRGRIRRLFAGGEDGWRILKPGLNKTGTGYYQVTLHAGGKKKTNQLVHQIVARAFHGPKPVGLVVRHRNGNSLLNHESNLIYGTKSENQMDRVLHGTSNRGSRHGLSKLTVEQVRQIKDRYQPGLGKKLAKEFGVSGQTITRIGRGDTYKEAA